MARKLVPRTRANGTMTEAGYWGFIRGGLRQKWSRYPVRYHAMANASRKYKGTDKRRKQEYQCAKCKGWYMGKEVEVDHIIPCGSLKSYADLPGFVERLFCEIDGVRVVCKPCHLKITAAARKK
jgi:hypothetical protein